MCARAAAGCYTLAMCLCIRVEANCTFSRDYTSITVLAFPATNPIDPAAGRYPLFLSRLREFRSPA